MSEFSIVYTSATSQLQKLTGICQYSIPCLLEYSQFSEVNWQAPVTLRSFSRTAPESLHRCPISSLSPTSDCLEPAKIYTIINFTSKDNLDNRALHDSPFIIVQILLVPIKYNEKGNLPYIQPNYIQWCSLRLNQGSTQHLFQFRLAFKQVAKIQMYLMTITGKENLPGISCDFAGKGEYTSSIQVAGSVALCSKAVANKSNFSWCLTLGERSNDYVDLCTVDICTNHCTCNTCRNF